MTPLELLRSAIAGISGNLVRSVLTLLMVVIGVASVVTLVAVGNGSLLAVNSKIASLGATSITVSGGFTDAGAVPLSLEQADALSKEPGTAITRVAPQVETQKKATIGGKSVDVTIVGTTPKYFTITNSTIADGRTLNTTDSVATRSVAVIGADFATRYFPGGGAVGNTIVVDATPLTIVGVMAPRDDMMSSASQSIIVPIERAQASFTGVQPLTSITFSARSVDDVTLATDQARTILTAGNPNPDPNALFFSSQQELRSVLGGSSVTLNNMLAGVASISLIVGGIGVTNVMLLTVRERTREIGIRKALGAKGREIAGQFTLEATILSVLGGLIGLGVSLVISAFTILDVKPVVLPSSALLAFGLSVAIGVVFGTYPAIRAARMSPVTALRSGT